MTVGEIYFTKGIQDCEADPRASIARFQIRVEHSDLWFQQMIDIESGGCPGM